MANLRANIQHCFSPPELRAYFAEFFSTSVFVFTTVGSTVSAQMLTPDDATTDASSLVATVVAQGFGHFATVFIAADVSGGHVNPAVTFAFAMDGHIAVPSAIFYWAFQMLGSTFACLVPQTSTTSLLAGHAAMITSAMPTTRIAVQMTTQFGAAILEGVLTFMVVYTVHVAGDTRGGRKGPAATALGALVVGAVTGACVLAAWSLTGASMDPARSFGAAVVSGDYENQAVYWVGPMVGAAVVAGPGPEPQPNEPRRHGSVETVVVV